MTDPADAMLALAERRNKAKDIETIRQTIRELSHALHVGEHWFTKGRSGQLSHARMWIDRGLASVTEIEGVLEQAQDCINGETPEDCTVEEAKADTVQKIRTVLALNG